MNERHDFHPAYFATRIQVTTLIPSWPEQFVIVTAHATTGERWTEEQNAESNARLLQRIEELRVRHHPITGYDPGTGHAEPGWAAEVPTAVGVALGEEFRQDAIYAVDRDVLRVVSCRNEARAIVGAFSGRVSLNGAR